MEPNEFQKTLEKIPELAQNAISIMLAYMITSALTLATTVRTLVQTLANGRFGSARDIPAGAQSGDLGVRAPCK